MDTYVLIKLSSGEELIGKQTKDNILDDRIHLSAPAVLVFDNQNFAMIPFLPFAKNHEVSFIVSNLTVPPTVPDEKLIAEYKRVYEKDSIIVPSKNIIV